MPTYDIWCITKDANGGIASITIKKNNQKESYTVEELTRYWDEKDWRFRLVTREDIRKVGRRKRNNMYYLCTEPDGKEFNNLAELDLC
jgi:hypothetical protein